MKKFFYLILTFSMLVYLNPVKSQSYGFEMKLDNFKQVSEYEFQFESYIRKIALTDNMAIDVFQFQVQYSPNILNSGSILNENLTFDNTTSGLVGGVKTGEFKSVTGNRLLFVSGDAGPSGSPVTVLTDAWIKVGVFSVKLSNGSGFINFGSAAPVFGFRSDPTILYTSLTRCNFTGSPGNYIKSGTSIFPVSTRTLTPEHGVAMNLRQLAGYWFYGDGLASDATKWNTVLKAANPAYVQNGPQGDYVNVVINGNCTLPTGMKGEIKPDINGNGGELTVNKSIYTLTITSNDPTNTYVRYRYPAGTGSWTTNATSYSISLEAGQLIDVRTATLDYTVFVNWASNAGGSFVNPNTANFATFTMPANNVTVTANWDLNSKSYSIIPFKDIDELNLTEPVYADNFKQISALYTSLTVEPGAGLKLDKLYNDNTNGAAAILVKSDATGTGYLIHNNTGVLATIERYLTPKIYHYVSSPITNAQYSLLQGDIAEVDFFQWQESNRTWYNLNDTLPLPVGTLVPGKGYALAYGGLTPITKQFAGAITVGDVAFSATYTPGSVSPFWNQRGFNLVGNPYSAALDAKAFLTAHTSVYGLYFWDEAADYLGNRNDYATYSLAGGVGTAAGGNHSFTPDGKIAPMQGFMLQVKSTPFNANATIPITFTNAMRITNDAYFYKDQSENDRIWLSVTGPEQDYNEILVAFMDGAQAGLDQTDAEKLKGNSMLAFYSTLEGGDFVIQGLPVLNSTDTYEIPLGVDAGLAGQYTFDVQKIENFISGSAITLEDRLAGKMINLRTNPQYVAQISTPGEIRGRFYLHFNGPTTVPVIEQKLTKVYAINNQIFVELFGNNKILDVEVLNTLGQSVLKTTVNATEATINVNGSNVVYMVKVRTSQGVETHKILLH